MAEKAISGWRLAPMMVVFERKMIALSSGLGEKQLHWSGA